MDCKDFFLLRPRRRQGYAGRALDLRTFTPSSQCTLCPAATTVWLGTTEIFIAALIYPFVIPPKRSRRQSER
jgi:hypothetical protein